MPTFPASLPAPLVAGYTLAPVDQTARTDMEIGAARVRRRTAARNDLVDVSWLLSAAQFVAFRAWFEDGATGISGGSSWFDMSMDVGAGPSVEEVRFKGAWKASRDSAMWRVTAQIEVRRCPTTRYRRR